MHKSDLATGKSQAMEEDSCYFSRFPEGHSAHAMGLESKRGPVHGKHIGVQEQYSAVHELFVPAKSVRLL